MVFCIMHKYVLVNCLPQDWNKGNKREYYFGTHNVYWPRSSKEGIVFGQMLEMHAIVASESSPLSFLLYIGVSQEQKILGMSTSCELLLLFSSHKNF